MSLYFCNPLTSNAIAGVDEQMLWVLVRLLLRIRGGENGSLRNHRRRNNLPRAVGAGYDQRGQRVAQVQQTLTLTPTPTPTAPNPKPKPKPKPKPNPHPDNPVLYVGF